MVVRIAITEHRCNDDIDAPGGLFGSALGHRPTEQRIGNNRGMGAMLFNGGRGQDGNGVGGQAADLFARHLGK